MAASAKRLTTKVVPILALESLYVGIDVGKNAHVAGFISTTLLQRHVQFDACPSLRFENSREGFRQLIDRIQSYVPLEQCYVLLEKTGHYHFALVQYLQELDVPVYLVHVQERPKGLIKTDKRDALSLGNSLYNQLDKGIQVSDKLQLIRRVVAPSAAAANLRGLLRHRYELSHEASRRKNKLTAICDELFPEFTRIFRDPNLPTALAVRRAFPTPQAVAAASPENLIKLRIGRLPSNAKLTELRELATQSIGTKEGARQQSLVFEQNQLIKELTLFQEHLDELDAKIRIEQTTRTMLMRGEHNTLLEWFAALPDSLILARPELSLGRAWALVQSGQSDAVEPYLRDIEHALQRNTRSILHGDVRADIREIQELLGHESLETTQRYLALDPERLRAAVELLPDEW